MCSAEQLVLLQSFEAQLISDLELATSRDQYLRVSLYLARVRELMAVPSCYTGLHGTEIEGSPGQ